MAEGSTMTIEEVVKIVLSVMGILILIYLCVSLVGIFTLKTASEQAKANLEGIKNIVNNLGENQVQSYTLELPKGAVVLVSNKKELCICEFPNNVQMTCEEGWYVCENLSVGEIRILASINEKAAGFTSQSNAFHMGYWKDGDFIDVLIKKIYITKKENVLSIETIYHLQESAKEQETDEANSKIEPTISTKVLSLSSLFKTKDSLSSFNKEIKQMLGSTFSLIKLSYLEITVRSHDSSYTKPFTNWEMTFYENREGKFIFLKTFLEGTLSKSKSCFEEFYNEEEKDYKLVFCIE